MWKKLWKSIAAGTVLAGLCICLAASDATASIEGLTGSSFTLTAKTGNITTGDGGSVFIWGYANGGSTVQYPGPTLILEQNDMITVTLNNQLNVPVSIVFPGQTGVNATGGVQGLLTREAPPGGSVTYTFRALQPGTYAYHSGTDIALQIEMGLVGAIIVRPSGAAMTAYGTSDSMYDHEYLFLLTEMDPRIHEIVRFQGTEGLAGKNYLTNYFPVLWFINGRCAPDTMLDSGVPWLPTQPYNCMPMMHPGERLLMRVIGGGRDLHPFHHHGNHARVIARDGRLLESTAGAGADLSHEVFTIQSVPGKTADAIFEWTGKGLGWDIYGHTPEDPLQPNEYAPDHGKPFPVMLPEKQDLTFGAMYGGSPFLGVQGGLPPGQGTENAEGFFSYMWHSHTEKEMVNYDVFPGGMMTMLVIVPPGVPIGMPMEQREEK